MHSFNNWTRSANLIGSIGNGHSLVRFQKKIPIALEMRSTPVELADS